MFKRLLLVSLSLFIGGFLFGCTSQTASYTESWKERAENGGFSLESNDGAQLLFTDQGMKATALAFVGEEKEKPFPFKEERYYRDYDISKKGNILTIETENGLKYPLTVKGDRLYVDEEHNIEYRAEEYLLKTSKK